MDYFTLDIDDVSQLTLEAKTGGLQVLLKTAQAGPQVRLLLTPEASRKLWSLLDASQQALETVVEGAPPSGARH